MTVGWSAARASFNARVSSAGGAGSYYRHTEVVGRWSHVLLFSEVGPVQAEATPDLLDLDQGEPAVVENDDGQGQSEAPRYSHLTTCHLEAPVPDERHHSTLRAGELGGDGRRKPEPYGGPAVRDQKRARRVSRPLGRDLMGVGSHVERQDAVAGEHFSYHVDRVMGHEPRQPGTK